MIQEFIKDASSDNVYFPQTIHKTSFKAYITDIQDHMKKKSLKKWTTTLKTQYINWAGCQKDGKSIASDSEAKLAEGEWNRYFQKAVCMIAISEGKKIKVCRWRESRHPKDVPGFTEGTTHDPQAFYNTIESYPFGANTGLTIEID